MSLGEASAADTLGELQGKGDKYTRLQLIEVKKYEDLKDAIRYIMEESDKFREKAKKAAIDVMNINVLTPNPAYSRADGVNIGREAQMVTTKTLNILEAKLNKLLQRKSEVINIVKQKKELINHYRRLRTQTDITHEKFKNNISEAKEEIESFLGESAEVVEQRQHRVEEKDALEKLNIDEQRMFQERYEDMGRFIKAQNDALEYALLQERKNEKPVSTNNRNSASSPPTTANANNNTRSTFDLTNPTNKAGMASTLTLAQEVELARNVGVLTSNISSEQKALTELKRRIATYESMFEQLKKMTGVESLDDMVSNYTASEEDMFSLYNFIQTTNAEIEAMTEARERTQRDIELFKAEHAMQELQRRAAVDELNGRIQSMLAATLAMTAENEAKQESITQIAKKVNTVFYKLQCDQMDSKGGGGGGTSKSGRFGGSTGGNRQDSRIAQLSSAQGLPIESIVLELLGCIEQRAIDIITEYLRVQASKEGTLIAGKQTAFVGGARSPTPGPGSPMRAHHTRGAMFDLDDASDDEKIDALLGTGGPSTFGNGGFSTSAAMASAAENVPLADGDGKVIDINLFRSRLERQLVTRDHAPSSPLAFSANYRTSGGNGNSQQRK